MLKNVLGVKMNYQTNKVGDILIFKLNEKRLDTNISGLLKGEFTLAFKEGNFNNLIIDLSEVESCDSSGLSAILVANRLVSSSNGQIRIASPKEKVMNLIKVTQLDRVLSVSDSVEEAISEMV